MNVKKKQLKDQKIPTWLKFWTRTWTAIEWKYTTRWFIVGFLIVGSVVVFQQAFYFAEDALEIYYDADVQEILLLRDAIKSGTALNYEVECDFEEVNTYLTGHFEKQYLPSVWKYTELNGSMGRTYKSHIDTTYVPERFDIEGFKGLNCRMTGGVN